MGSAASVLRKLPKADRPKCAATTRAGTPCKRDRGAGTDHPGFGHCANHGGNTESGAKAAAREIETWLGAELDMEPHDALLLTVRRAARWEAVCAREVARLDPDHVIVRFEKTKREYSPRIRFDEAADEWTTEGTVIESTVETSTVAELHIWVREHLKALDQLSRLAKTALDAGVDERRVRQLEESAGDLATWLGPFLTELGVMGDQRTPAIVRKHLMLLEGGQAA